MDDMVETMHSANGIGLAAPQVGVHKRVIVVVVRDEEGDDVETLCMANPEIAWASDEEATGHEGCLSFPEHYADVTRPARVRVRYLDHDGQERDLEADGVLAACTQHEIDHLDGILFVDYLSLLKRNIILRKLSKTKRTNEKVAV